MAKKVNIKGKTAAKSGVGKKATAAKAPKAPVAKTSTRDSSRKESTRKVAKEINIRVGEISKATTKAIAEIQKTAKAKVAEIKKEAKSNSKVAAYSEVSESIVVNGIRLKKVSCHKNNVDALLAAEYARENKKALVRRKGNCIFVAPNARVAKDKELNTTQVRRGTTAKRKAA